MLQAAIDGWDRRLASSSDRAAGEVTGFAGAPIRPACKLLAVYPVIESLRAGDTSRRSTAYLWYVSIRATPGSQQSRRFCWGSVRRTCNLLMTGYIHFEHENQDFFDS
ncbi:MAG: hypothetical protein LBF72_00235 [Holosporales bacterium]|nr:hypothetical protein [Holosporales bacterium]